MGLNQMMSKYLKCSSLICSQDWCCTDMSSMGLSIFQPLLSSPSRLTSCCPIINLLDSSSAILSIIQSFATFQTSFPEVPRIESLYNFLSLSVIPQINSNSPCKNNNSLIKIKKKYEILPYFQDLYPNLTKKIY